MNTTPSMINQTDHDKVTQYSQKVDDFKEATLELFQDLKNRNKIEDEELQHLEDRVRSIVKIIENSDIQNLIKQVKEDSQWIRDFKLLYKILGIVYPLILFIIGLAISSKINPAFLFKNLGF